MSKAQTIKSKIDANGLPLFSTIWDTVITNLGESSVTKFVVYPPTNCCIFHFDDGSQLVADFTGNLVTKVIDNA